MKHRLTDEIKDRVTNIWSDASIDSVRALAERLGVPLSTAESWRKKLKLPGRRSIPDKWPEARSAELERLWNEGVTAAEIGRRLGVTKNAAIGMVHRLGLDARRAPPRLPPPPDPYRGNPPACRWPHGDPRNPDFHFCGARQVEGRSYCADHIALAYIRGSAAKL